MKKDANVVLLKTLDETDKFKAHLITIDKLNENYHKYVSDPQIKYFVIPVSNIENLYFILDRNYMPQIFKKITIWYQIHIRMCHKNHSQSNIYSQEICTKIETPQELFAFIYNLCELAQFNCDFNNYSWADSDIFYYEITKYKIDNGLDSKYIEIAGVDQFIDVLIDYYGIFMNLKEKQTETFMHRVLYINDNNIAEMYTIDGGIPQESGYQDNIDKLYEINKECHSQFIMSYNVFSLEGFHIYTFISGTNAMMFSESYISETYKSGVIELGYGTQFANDDWTDLNDGSFTPMKTNTVHVIHLDEFIKFIKIAKLNLRIIKNLLSMPTETQIFDNMYPYFSYNFRMEPLTSYREDKKYVDPHYFRDYIVKSDRDLLNIDPYSDFVKDIEDYFIPF